MTRLRLSLSGVFLCVLTLLPDSAHTAAGQHVESFTTTTYREPTTTANWDTGAGQLKLHVFTPSLVGSYDTSNIAYGVAVAGNLAVLADGEAGVLLFDVTNLASPTPLGSYDTPGIAYDVVISGDLAFAAVDDIGLQIINIANPASPMLVATLDTPGTAIGVAVDGDLAFVADAFNGLHIVDVSNPALPFIVKTHDTPGLAVRVTVAGNLVFVADDTSGMAIVDVTDPTAPFLVGTYDSPGNATDVAVSGNLAFIADGASGLQIVNITNPASPTFVGSYDTPGTAVGIAVAGDVAFVADDAAGLQMIVITNPAAPTLAHNVDTSGGAFGVVVDGGHAFIADQLAGMQIVEVADLSYPRFIGFRDTQDSAYGVAVDGDFAFMASGTAGVYVFGISNPFAPTTVGTYNTPGTAFGVAVAGDLLFVADGSTGLIILNIANPASPSLVATYDTPGTASNVAVQGNLAFVADGSSGLQVISILNPAIPAFVGAYDTPGVAGNVAVSGDLVLVSDALLNFGVRIIDVSNPASPALLSTYTAIGAPAGISIAGDHAYVAFDTGLQIVNISNPASPSTVGSFGPLVTQDVEVMGNLALVTRNQELMLVDVSNPASPTFIMSRPTIGQAYAITSQGELAFVADGMWGLNTTEVFNHDFYTQDNYAFSLKINSGIDPIVAVRFTSSQTLGVTWAIAADNGNVMQTMAPDNVWRSLTYEGNNLRWSTVHIVPPAGGNPTVSDVTIEWLYQFATIDAVADVPNDQGGFVRLRYTRSGRDLASDAFPILHYGVWRRVDDVALRGTLAGAPRDLDAVDPSLAKAFDTLPLFTHDGRTFVESSRLHTAATFPPGTWEWMATIPALQQHNYVATFPTEADAPSQVVLVVTAHTATPATWFVSSADSGSSVDNIAPPVPVGFEVAYNTGDGNTLTWDPSPASDFQTFRVYRSTDPGFTPSPATLVHSTTASDWSDPDYDGGLVHYKITAVDYAGNESGAATAGTVTSTDGPAVPEIAALYQNHPNPFNPTTRIRYDVPSGGANVELAIYDVSGRRIRALVSRREEAGAKAIDWDGHDDAGAVAATGVYFYRISIGSYANTRKMVLLK